ncbi:MAG TPA: hypothetical protein VE325_13735, partial [Burkholderiales bacterium]|nr:hypothetical protein [Burkholderiales bacterium]
MGFFLDAAARVERWATPWFAAAFLCLLALSVVSCGGSRGGTGSQLAVFAAADGASGMELWKTD